MSCDRIQFELSRAIDEHRDLAAFDAHLSVCHDCGDFATVSRDLGERYRRRVTQGIDRLRRGMPPATQKRRPAGWLLPLAAAFSVLWSVPLRPPPPLPAIWASPASARVPLYDDVRFDPVDLRALAWSGEPPLPGRLDQDLPSSLSPDADPGITLPSTLRF
jgi:hypothetical protein